MAKLRLDIELDYDADLIGADPRRIVRLIRQ
jgi:hypothetical protein